LQRRRCNGAACTHDHQKFAPTCGDKATTHHLIFRTGDACRQCELLKPKKILKNDTSKHVEKRHIETAMSIESNQFQGQERLSPEDARQEICKQKSKSHIETCRKTTYRDDNEH